MNRILEVFIDRAPVGTLSENLKNLSLYPGKEGYRLAPHYDLVSTASWATPELMGAQAPVWPNIDLSFPIGDARTFAELTAGDVLKFADHLGVPASVAKRELARQTEAIVPAAQKIMGEYEARTDVPEDARAKQINMLRTILHLPVMEMRNRLK